MISSSLNLFFSVPPLYFSPRLLPFVPLSLSLISTPFPFFGTVRSFLYHPFTLYIQSIYFVSIFIFWEYRERRLYGGNRGRILTEHCAIF